MTPAQFLDIVIPKWQQSLPPKYTPTLIARFIASRRKDLEGMVGDAFALRRARQGKAPRDVAEWVAYGSLVGPGRERDAEPDAKIIRRIQSRMEKLEQQLGQDADARAAAWSMAVEFVQQRAQAILMGARGWDAIPLLLRRPATILLSKGRIVAIQGVGAALYVIPHHDVIPNFYLDKLRADVEETRKQLGEVAALASSRSSSGGPWVCGPWRGRASPPSRPRGVARDRVAAGPA
jgi:hypothetical protein